MLERREYKVYRFKTSSNAIIYVGMTGKLTERRFSEHVKDKYWKHEISEVDELVLENEAQARLIEMYYINEYKPVFNMDEIYAGKIRNNLHPKYKKFSHAFYALNGKKTNCIPQFNEDYTLVDIKEIDGAEIGIYYDSALVLYYSASDICKLLGITNKKLYGISKNNEYFKSVTYNELRNGINKEKTAILCTYYGMLELLKVINDTVKTEMLEQELQCCYYNGDLYQTYSSREEIDYALEYYLNALSLLDGDNERNWVLKRRLAYQSISSFEDIYSVVERQNKEMSYYNTFAPIAKKGAEVFSMINDVCNEHNVSYKDVIMDFNESVLGKIGIDFWKIKDAIENKHGHEFKCYQAIAHSTDVLYQPFVYYYNSKID